MDNNNKINIGDMNKDLHMTVEYMLRGMTNEIIAWAAFADRHTPNNVNSDADSVNPEHLELLNTIEKDVKKKIINNINDFNFSTYDSAEKSINLFLVAFLSVKENKNLGRLVNHEKFTFILMAAAVILYREASLFAFANSHYHVAIRLYSLSRDVNSQIQFVNKQFMENFKQELSRRNKKPNDARWQGHVEQLRRKYLKLDEHRQDEIGEYLTINDATTWIYINHNKEELTFDTIRGHVSKARKGIFTNK